MLNIKPESYGVQPKVITSFRRSMTGQLQGGGMVVPILCPQALPFPLPLLPSPPPPRLFAPSRRLFSSLFLRPESLLTG